MSAERQARLHAELRATFALLGTLDNVAEQLMDDPDVEALEAVRVLLARQLSRVDMLLLELTRDRLDDERGLSD